MEWRLKTPVRLLAAQAIADFLRAHQVEVPEEKVSELAHMLSDRCRSFDRTVDFDRYKKNVQVNDCLNKPQLSVKLHDGFYDNLDSDTEFRLNSTLGDELNQFVHQATGGMVGVVPEDYQNYVDPIHRFAEGSETFQALDRAFPNSKSRKIVVLDGVRYRKRYFPLDMSRSGKTVYGWGSYWETVR